MKTNLIAAFKEKMMDKAIDNPSTVNVERKKMFEKLMNIASQNKHEYSESDLEKLKRVKESLENNAISPAHKMILKHITRKIELLENN